MRYIPTIGIEIHVQLATKTKMFCGCKSDDRGAEPNSNVCPVCFGLPGALPVVNKRAVELAIKLGKGFNAKIAETTKFDRKNYFYPDSPKGYQITQLDLPIVYDGWIEILVGGEFSKVRINRAHLEEDAGKLIHPAGADYSLVDLNRCGTPLVEIVSEPDMHTPEEAKRYLQEVYNIATSLGVTQGDMQHGNFKFDLNVSVSDRVNGLGTKVELKNLNSFRNAERALAYEIKRQTDMLEAGEEIIQETRGWDDARAKTFSQRSKEEANDYRYFPEPDIPPLVIQPDFVDEVQAEISVLPIDVRRELQSLGYSVMEQDILIGQPQTMEIYQDAREILQDKDLEKKAVNWLVGDYQNELKVKAQFKRHIESGKEASAFFEGDLRTDDIETRLTGKNLAELIKLVDLGEISSKIAKDIFAEVIRGKSPDQVIKSKGLAQVSDDAALDTIIYEVLKNNPQAKNDFLAGKPQAQGFLMGQIMKATKGQANPGKAQNLLTSILKKEK